MTNDKVVADTSVIYGEKTTATTEYEGKKKVAAVVSATYMRT